MEAPANVKPSGLRWKWWDWTLIVVTALVTAWAYYGAIYAYIAGNQNRNSGVYTAVMLTAFGCATWLVPIILAIVLLFVRRPPPYRAFIYLGIALLPIVVGIGANWLNGGEYDQFTRGFKAWMVREVHTEPIQAWLKKQLGAPNTSTILPPTSWPPEIMRLRPERVDLWRERGVVLTWGRVGHDGDRRQVFIGRSIDMPPPTEVLWLDDNWLDAWRPIHDDWPAEWKSIKPGVWWWIN